MKNHLIFCIFLILLSFGGYTQDNSFRIKLGYVMSNAYYPNSNLVIYTDGTGGQGNDSFSYKSGFQDGFFAKIPFKSSPGFFYFSVQ